MAPDGTGDDGVDPKRRRNQVVADTIKIVSTSLLGLTVGCAQCHDHRYDPIPQADYYRLRAVFEPAYDWKNWRRAAQRLVSLYTDADRAKARRDRGRARRSRRSTREAEAATALRSSRRELAKFPPNCATPRSRPLRRARRTSGPPSRRSCSRRTRALNVNAGVLYPVRRKTARGRAEGDDRRSSREAARARKPVEEFVQCPDRSAGHGAGDATCSTAATTTSRKARTSRPAS